MFLGINGPILLLVQLRSTTWALVMEMIEQCKETTNNERSLMVVLDPSVIKVLLPRVLLMFKHSVFEIIQNFQLQDIY